MAPKILGMVITDIVYKNYDATWSVMVLLRSLRHRWRDSNVRCAFNLSSKFGSFNSVLTLDSRILQFFNLSATREWISESKPQSASARQSSAWSRWSKVTRSGSRRSLSPRQPRTLSSNKSGGRKRIRQLKKFSKLRQITLTLEAITWS